MILNGEKNMSKFNEKLIKSYDENSDKGYIFKADTEYPKRLYNFFNDLPFLSERIKTKKGNKLVCNHYEKSNYVAHIRTYKNKH